MNKTIIKSVGVTILVIALLLGVSYYGLVKYNQVYNQGVQDGAEQIILEMMQTLVKCEALKVPYQDQTVNIVLLECLNQTRGS